MHRPFAVLTAGFAPEGEILKTSTKIAPEVIATMNLPRRGTGINRESVRAIADVAQGDGVLKNKADAAALIP